MLFNLTLLTMKRFVLGLTMMVTGTVWLSQLMCDWDFSWLWQYALASSIILLGFQYMTGISAGAQKDSVSVEKE